MIFYKNSILTTIHLKNHFICLSIWMIIFFVYFMHSYIFVKTKYFSFFFFIIIVLCLHQFTEVNIRIGLNLKTIFSGCLFKVFIIFEIQFFLVFNDSLHHSCSLSNISFHQFLQVQREANVFTFIRGYLVYYNVLYLADIIPSKKKIIHVFIDIANQNFKKN